MKHINPKAVISSSTEANGYLKLLKNIGAFKHMVDAYLFAAAYAMENNLEITSVPSSQRHDVARIDVVDKRVLLAIEAGVYAVCKRNGQPQPSDSKEVLEIVIQYAEAGLCVLKQRWEGKISIQIQDDIRKLISLEQ
jgi:hypothetical protein